MVYELCRSRAHGHKSRTTTTATTRWIQYMLLCMYLISQQLHIVYRHVNKRRILSLVASCLCAFKSTNSTAHTWENSWPLWSFYRTNDGFNYSKIILFFLQIFLAFVSCESKQREFIIFLWHNYAVVMQSEWFVLFAIGLLLLLWDWWWYVDTVQVLMCICVPAISVRRK